MVFLYSWYTVSRISWHVVQNSSEFVMWMPVWNPPHAMIPATKNTEAIASTEYFVLGRFNRLQVRRMKPPLAFGGPGSSAEGVNTAHAHCIDIKVGRLHPRADVR